MPEAGSLTVTWRWSRWPVALVVGPILLFAALSLALVRNLLFDSSAEPTGLWVVSAFCFLVASVLGLFAVRRWHMRTVLRIEGQQLTVRREPYHPTGGVTLDASSIVETSSHRDVSFDRFFDDYHTRVWLEDGRTIAVLSDLKGPAEADHIAWIVAQHLGCDWVPESTGRSRDPRRG